jgi:hypothetical protein
LERGHQDFDGASTVHFLTDDLLDLAQRPQAKREERVNAARELAEQSGPQQEFMGEYFRVRRGFSEGGNQSLCPTHERLLLYDLGFANRGRFLAMAKTVNRKPVWMDSFHRID